TARRLPMCGNQITEAGETCDDGNFEDGDCCDAACRLESGCSGPCNRSSDCHPEAWCVRSAADARAGCPTTAGTCDYWPPSLREHDCPSHPTSSSTVCGCDRRTYDTVCEAREAGVAIVGSGPCPCQESVDPCPDGHWCDVQYPWNSCDDAIARRH